MTRRQKISTIPVAIKLAVALGCGSLLPLSSAGCAASVAEAPFPARPDTTVPGDLRGPFGGRVVEAEGGKPVEGAEVLGSWSFETGRGLTGPAEARSALVTTDGEGRYQMGPVELPRDPRKRLVRFTLVVYKAGFLGWRSDRREADFSPRHDFAQGGGEVRLERFPDGGSHARQVRYLGWGGPLLARFEPELAEAAGEAVAGRAAAAAPAAPPPVRAEEGVPLDATRLLSADELQAVTGFKGQFTVEPLADRPRSPRYDSAHFRAVGQGERFDAAIRVHRLPRAEAEAKYQSLLGELPGAKARDEVGDRSLRAREGEIFGVAALDRERGVVVEFTCGEGLCKDAETAVALVKRMWPRLGRLGRAEEAAPVEKPVEKPGEPGEKEDGAGPGEKAPSGPFQLRPSGSPPPSGSRP